MTFTLVQRQMSKTTFLTLELLMTNGTSPVQIYGYLGHSINDAIPPFFTSVRTTQQLKYVQDSLNNIND